MNLAALAARAIKADRSELPLVGAAAGYFFLLLCGYYVLRPIRDEMAIRSGVANLPLLMTVTFLVMLAVTPVFGFIAARMPRRRMLPAVYGFFAANLVVFFFAFRSGWQGPWVARAFVVWLSVFNLFVVSVFWSFMADLFSERQAARLFAVISAGGSIGAICGPAVTEALVEPVGIQNLMLVSAALLVACIGCIRFLGRQAHGSASAEARLGGGALAGIRLAFASPYLLAVCGYIFALTWTSVLLFLTQAGVIATLIPSSVDRTRLFARIDEIVNVGTFVCQLFVTNRMVMRLGLVTALLFLPAVSVMGFSWIAAAPTLAAFVTFTAVRRIAEYAVSKPARETLFTVLERESKYKAKNFIDTAFTRGGEAVSGWTVSVAKALGSSGSQLALIAVPIAMLWSAAAFYLAARFDRVSAARAQAGSRG